MKNKNTNPQKQNLTMYMIYAAIALLLINFIFVFIPFVEIYQPSQSKTFMGVTTYEDWFVDSASMAKFIFPLIFMLPYGFAISSFRTKKEKSPFVKIKENKVDKPIRFTSLIIASIANLVSMLILFNYLKDEISIYEKHGAYCRLTAGGIFYIIFTIALILVLFALSYLSTRMVNTINSTEESINEESEFETK